MGESPWITADGACVFPAPYEENSDEDSSSEAAALPQDTPLQSLDNYVGTYNNPGFGDVVITIQRSPNKQLFMSMGKYLRAQLFYNASDKTFYTNLTGVYWYMDDRIPVRFDSSGQDIDILNMPMHSPFSSTVPFAFTRGKAQAERQLNDHKFSCSSLATSCKILHSTTALCVLVIFVFFSHLR